MGRKQISCAEADALRARLKPHSSCTNYVGGEVLNPDLPPHTSTTWGRDDVDILSEVLDADGCRHYRLTDGDE